MDFVNLDLDATIKVLAIIAGVIGVILIALNLLRREDVEDALDTKLYNIDEDPHLSEVRDTHAKKEIDDAV